MNATSKLIPNMSGPIVEHIDSEHFIVQFAGCRILAHKDWWIII